LAFDFFAAGAFFAGGFFAAPAAAAGFFLPFVAKHLRSYVAVNPCCLHNFFTVSKSASFDAASNFAFSSASYLYCLAIS
jgi:hypothetical protein